MPGQGMKTDRYRHGIARVVAVGAGLLLAALAGRLLYIKTTLSPTLIAMMDSQQQSRSVLTARRGTIFDARGRVLAGSRQVPSAFADPSGIEQVDQTAAAAAAILQMDAGQVEEHIRHSSSPRFCWVKHRVSAAEAQAVRRANIAGIGLIHEPVRHYPEGTSMGQVLGFVGKDGQGLEGIELARDAHLRGTDGQVWTVRDVRRRSIRVSDDRGRPGTDPIDGGHVVLTLDSVIQGFLEEQLADRVEQFEAHSGVGVVMDPGTGDVLAMACYPPFAPAEYQRYAPLLRRNRVVTDMVEPGSTFKPFVASGALVEGVVSREETIFCHNGLHVIGRRRLHDASPHGHMTFAEIVARSSNIGMAIIGERMGNAAIHRIVRRFGFGQRADIDFPGESPGSVLPLSKWTSYSTSSVPMGQEIAVTPLQLITAFCAILNDGVSLRPRVLRALLSPEGTVVEEFVGPQPVRRVLPIETARYLSQEVLVAVVNGGSGRRAALPNYQVLGKTGTAQVPYEDRRGYEPEAYLASFVGAAPAEDPRLAVLVMINRPNPRLGYYGSVVSAPAVREILAETLAYLQVPPQTNGAASQM